jgi:23S rRNA pseudouridine2604 synthase
MSNSIRLAKRVIELSGCSRSQAEQYIEGGLVSVDGSVVDQPQFMVMDQSVTIDTSRTPTPLEPVTLLFHKPAGVAVAQDNVSTLQLITPLTRWEADSSGIRCLKRHFTRLTPLLPLDLRESGLQAFTQDGRMAWRTRENSLRIEQELVVEVSGDIAPYGLAKLSEGLRMGRLQLPAAKVSWQSENRLRFAVKGLQAGQLERMCEGVGLTAVTVRRIRIGRIALAKMPVGEWRYLPYGEIF